MLPIKRHIVQMPPFDALIFVDHDLPYFFRRDYNIKFQPVVHIQHPDSVQRYKSLLKVIMLLITTFPYNIKLRKHHSDHVDWQLVEISHSGGAVQSNIDGFDHSDILR